MPTDQDLGDLAQQVKLYKVLAEEVDLMSSRKNEVRAQIMQWLRENLEPKDEKGNYEVLLPEPLSINGKDYRRVMIQVRTSTALDAPVAEELLRGLGLYDLATTTEVYLVPEKVVDLWVNGKIPDEDYVGIWEHKTTPALVVR